MKKILIIDDEPSVCLFLRHSLERQNFTVEEAHTGAIGIERFSTFDPDLIILDFGLPDFSGLEVLKHLRKITKVPILFLTVQDQESDKISALDFGADDYITKPFSVPELLARVRVAIRHTNMPDTHALIKVGNLTIDSDSHRVLLKNHEIKLTATEFLLLSMLAKNAGKLVPHKTILREIWGPHSTEHKHYLRVYFGQIRKKMDAALTGAGELIENEAGLGYRLKLG